MGVGMRDIFGTAGPEPATPGSYGEAGERGRLPDGTQLGPVRLQVADLERSVGFYEKVLGLRVVDREPGRAALTPQNDERVLIELRERSGARPVTPRRLGLYHYAILLPDRASLGRFVRHVSEAGVRIGAGDHLVSEALYLSDPDGHGIEVYADRPRDAWRRRGRELLMATDPVDVDDLLRVAGDGVWDGMPAGTVMGHVHLHVGDIAAAQAYYSDALGFDRITWSYPGALFMSAGGYHHHLGTNTWAGPGATAPDEGDAHLLEWTIVLPDASDVEAAAVRLLDAGYGLERVPGGFTTRDPWGTGLRVLAVARPL